MAYRKIHVKGLWQAEELVAQGAITPGHLCEENVNGKVVVHSEEGGRAERMFAYEDALQGGTVDTAYASGEQVFLMLVVPGSEICIRIAAGQNIGIGDELVSAGDGTLQKRGIGSSGVTEHQVIARATEAKDNSAGATAVLMRARIV
jgi:hypothetical protein